MLDTADQHMREGQFREAFDEYQEAWSKLSKELDQVQQVWLLLSIANAAVRLEEFEEAMDALSALLEYYAESKIIVGNPFFHLLVGLTYHGLNEDPEGETDNFARALICGGPEIFALEDPIHLERMKKLMRPPAETGTWAGYKGCSRELLNGATGYLCEQLTKKLGAPPGLCDK